MKRVDPARAKRYLARKDQGFPTSDGLRIPVPYTGPPGRSILASGLFTQALIDALNMPLPWSERWDRHKVTLHTESIPYIRRVTDVVVRNGEIL